MTSKELQNLRARAALVGSALEVTTDDQERPVYILTYGAQTIALRTGEDVEAWICGGATSLAAEGTHAP